MPSNFFGTPEGFRTYDADQAELAKMAAETKHQEALTRLNDTQAATMVRKQNSEDRLRAALGGGGAPGLAGAAPGGAPTMEDLLANARRQVGVLASVGEVDDAGKLLNQVASAAAHISRGDASAAAQKSRALGDEIKQLRLAQETLAGVRTGDKAGLDAALLSLQSNPLMRGLEVPSQIKSGDWRAINAFVAGSPAAIKKRELALKEIDEARKGADSKTLRDLRKIQGEVAERRATAYEERAANLGRAGAGKDTGLVLPTKAETASMTKALKRSDAFVDADQAEQLAERAKFLRANNPALTPDAAEARAIKEALDAGEIEVNKILPNKFAVKQGSATRPHSLPKSVDGLSIGQYYQAPDGSVAKFLGGSKWERVSKARKVPAPITADEGEEK